MGYNASKAALNMLTVQLAAELRDTGIKVNSADPGFTATDLNDHRGYQTVPQGAAAAFGRSRTSWSFSSSATRRTAGRCRMRSLNAV